MKNNCQPVTLPLMASTASAAIDVSGGFDGFAFQLENVTAATGVQYGVEGSLDGGSTWVDVTADLVDLGNAGGAVTPPMTADSIYDFRRRFPGLIHLICKHAPNAPPPANALPTAWVAFQDTRQV